MLFCGRVSNLAYCTGVAKGLLQGLSLFLGKYAVRTMGSRRGGVGLHGECRYACISRCAGFNLSPFRSVLFACFGCNVRFVCFCARSCS